MTKNIQTRHHYSMQKQNKIVYYDFAITNCNHALLNSINQIEQQICCRKLQTALNIPKVGKFSSDNFMKYKSIISEECSC